jgi:hypothetical protein
MPPKAGTATTKPRNSPGLPIACPSARTAGSLGFLEFDGCVHSHNPISDTAPYRISMAGRPRAALVGPARRRGRLVAEGKRHHEMVEHPAHEPPVDGLPTDDAQKIESDDHVRHQA